MFSEIRQLLLEEGMYDTEAEVDDLLAESQDSTTVQTLIFEKSVFKTKAEAIEWARTHGFHAEKVDETGDSWRLRQLDPGEFSPDSFRTIDIRRGVKAVIGKLREAEGSMLAFSLRNEKDTINFSTDLPHIIEIAKVVSGFHPVHGQVEITEEKLDSFIRNFDEGVLGVDIRIDYDHDRREAAGWINSLFKDPTGQVLLGEVKWTPKGALSLSDREFRYFSPSFTENFVHPHTGKEHGPTLKGGALVNDPFLRMEPIVNMNDKPEGDGMGKDTITLSEHEAKVKELEGKVTDGEVSLGEAKKTIQNLKDENKTLSEEVKTMKADADKAKKEQEHMKLFSDGKINKAQLEALREGKSMMEVLELSEKMPTTPKGNEGGSGQDYELSDAEKSMCMKLGLTHEEFVKYNKKSEE